MGMKKVIKIAFFSGLTLLMIIGQSPMVHARGTSLAYSSSGLTWEELIVILDTPQKIVDYFYQEIVYREETVEHLQLPEETLRLKSGDCEDFALFATEALIYHNYHDVKVFVVIFKESGEFDGHAVCVYRDKKTGDWSYIDQTFSGGPFSTLTDIADDLVGEWDVETIYGFAIYSPDVFRLYNEVYLLEDDERYLEAVADFDSLISTNGTNALVYTERGIAYYMLGRFREAISDFSKAMEMAPWFPDPYANRGLVYKDMGNFDRAIADFSRAIELDPEDVISYFNRGWAYEDSGRLDKALMDYTNVIRISPDDIDALNNRGIVYYDMGRFDDALQDFNRVIELFPEDTVALFNRGNLHYDAGRFDESIKDLSEVIRLDPDDAEAFYLRGWSYNSAGRFDEANRDFNKAREMGFQQSDF